MQPGDKNGWNEYSKYVLKELERLNRNIERMNDEFQKLVVEITTLKVKATVWGSIGGVIPVLLALLWEVTR